MASHGSPKWFDLPRGTYDTVDPMNLNVAETSSGAGADTFENGADILTETDPHVASILKAFEDNQISHEDAVEALDELAKRSL